MIERGGSVPPGDASSRAAFGDNAARAENAIAQRIFLLDRAVYVHRAPDYLDVHHGGLALCGKTAGKRTVELRRDGYVGVLLEDPALYETHAATVSQPFVLPSGRLFGCQLDDVLQEQRDRGATGAITPTGYIHVGDSGVLESLVQVAQRITRHDVIVAVPAAVAWLRDEHLPELISALQRISHPKALILGGQFDPLDAFTNAPRNLRRVVREVARVGLWRTDLAAFECLAHGGLFAAIGAGGSLRHMVPCEEKPRSRRGANVPSVLHAILLSFKRADVLARVYANVTPPKCWCRVCQGSLIDRFDGHTGEVRADAHGHNAALWNSWLHDLFRRSIRGERQAWWKDRCRTAVDAHERENRRVRQPHAFKPSKTLKAWATLP